MAGLSGKLVPQQKEDRIPDLSIIKNKKTDDLEFNIPSTWQVAHLESVSESIASKQFQIAASEFEAEGEYPVVSQSKEYIIGYSNNKTRLFHHDNPVIVFGDHTTIVKYVDFDFVVGADGVKIFSPNTDLISAKFFAYVLEYYSVGLEKVGGYSRHYKYIKNKSIPIPPLEEQNRIIAKIEELLPYIDSYADAYEKLEQLNDRFPEDMKKSILQYAVQGKLVEQRDEEGTAEEQFVEKCKEDKKQAIAEGKFRKEDYRGSIQLDDAPFVIPNSWIWMYISDMSLFQEGPGILGKDFRESGVPLIRIAGMQETTVSLEGCNYLDTQMVKEKWNHFRLDIGDIVISTSASMNKIAEVTSEAEGAIPYTGLIRFKMYGGINKEYFKWFIKSPFYMEQVNNQKSGGLIKHYGPTHLRRMIIPIPPLKEQRRIVDKVEELLSYCEQLS